MSADRPVWQDRPTAAPRPAPAADPREDFGRISFQGLPNTRDLGGLRTVDGRRVKPRRLLRSGTLGYATRPDLDRLRAEYALRAVVDFRGADEASELPDPMVALPDATYLNVPVLDFSADGVGQDEAARARVAAARAADRAGDVDASMEAVYPHIMLGPAGIAGYRAFFRRVLETPEGAVLWHCFVGRDRAGMASVLMEHLLGVPDEAVEADYLATNAYVPYAITQGTVADVRYLRAGLSAICEEYGDLDGYLGRGLGISAEQRDELRDRYLE